MTDIFPLIPGYQILKPMGQGGMASVYLAVQESFGRQVALKIMSDQLGKDDVWTKRFMHEARIVAQLSHTNIVPVFDVGSHEGRFYISMELLKGGKLDEKIARTLTIPEIVKIICGVAAGLDYAGSKGFVHRDIKPDNIMFRDDGTPVILDFGIAKQKDGDSKMTKTGTIVGTTGYMSPEQAMGLELDERSDIYSLGIMLYELLTGAVPFRGDSAVAVLLKHVQETPPPLPARLSAFQPVLDKALAKKPIDRYRRASEMVEHLQSIALPLKQEKNTTPTAVMKPVTGTNDATLVTTAINTSTTPTNATSAQKIRAPLLAVIGILVIALLGFIWKQMTIETTAPVPAIKEATVTAEPKTIPAPSPETAVVAKAMEPAPVVSEPAMESPAPAQEEATDNRRAIARILLSAHACMKERKYDCAKSKAESVLDLDPDNAIAKKMLANAEEAQKAAFEGDWNAK